MRATYFCNGIVTGYWFVHLGERLLSHFTIGRTVPTAANGNFSKLPLWNV